MILARTAAATTLSRHAAALQTLSDETLIMRIAAADQVALRALFARHEGCVYRFLVHMVQDERLAEELLGDVFLDVWRHAVKFEARAAVSTWLLAIGRHKALSALRRRRDVNLDDKMAGAIPDPGDDPEVVLQKKDTSEVLRKCVAALSAAQGQIIDLVYYHGKTIREVARTVGIPEATVKTRMFYARKNLAEMVRAA
jgi:RNA polymerase sigma-70 factor, ECF subfamily